MPYYCPSRPFVKGWFSATKRSIGDCAQKDEQEKLVEENGLTVLYQYLHRYASPDGRELNRRFVEAVEALLSNDSVKIDTVSNTMARLRVLQRIFLFFHDNVVWLVNANRVPVSSLQITFDKPTRLSSAACKIALVNTTANITDIPPNTIMRIESNKTIRVLGKRSFATRGRKTICQCIAYARLYVNLSDSPWLISNEFHLEPQSFSLETGQPGTGTPGLSRLPFMEESSLLIGQFWIVAREILFKGRSLNSSKYLDDSREIRLENHDNW
jgi:hypothetical protein